MDFLLGLFVFKWLFLDSSYEKKEKKGCVYVDRYNPIEVKDKDGKPIITMGAPPPSLIFPED